MSVDVTHINFSRATEQDYPDLVALQEENLITNLSEAEKKDGYLTVNWTEDQFHKANNNLAVFVAKDSNNLAGYRVATTTEFNEQIPLIKHMMGLFNKIKFQGKFLSEYKSFISGSCCIVKEYRGTAVLEGLFQALIKDIQKDYEIGIAFIAKDNTRSLRAVTRKLHMQLLEDFTFEGKEFSIVAFLIFPTTI